MLSDRYEVTLNLTEVYIPYSEQFATLKVRARLADKTLELTHLTQPSGTAQTYGITRATQLEVQLYADKYHVGGVVITLGDLYAVQVRGHVESWIKLELSTHATELPTTSPSLSRTLSGGESAASKRFARVKLAVDVTKLGVQRLDSSALQQLGSVRCPFLEKVQRAEHIDTETLDLYKTALAETTHLLTGSSSLLRLSQVVVLDVPEKYLDIEVPSLEGINFDHPTAGDASILKHIIIGLSNKIKALGAQVEADALMKEYLERSNKSRSDLQDSITETVEGIQRDNAETSLTLKHLEEARSAASSALSQARTDNTALQKALDQLMAESQLQKREILELRAKSAIQHEQDNQISSLKTLLKDSEDKIAKLSMDKESETAELYKLKMTHLTERRQITEEKEALEVKHIATVTELDATKDMVLEARGEVEVLKAKITDMRQSAGVSGVYDSYAQDNAQARTLLQQQIDILVAEGKAAADKAKQFQDKLRGDLKNLHEALEIVEEELETSQQKEREMRNQLVVAAGQISTLEELACAKEDLRDIREDLMKQNEMNRLVKGETICELDAAADYILVQAQRSKDSGLLLGQVEEALKEQDTEIEALRYAVALLKSKVTTYTPVLGDSVDEVLCDYLTHRDPAPLVPFVRESTEVYAYGTKRVFVRVDKGRINVKVGGGCIPLEEFLALYERTEADKIEARILQETQVRPESKARNVVAKLTSAGVLSRLGSIIDEVGDRSPAGRRPDRLLSTGSKLSRSSERKLSKPRS
jgi:hypothetical protein